MRHTLIALMEDRPAALNRVLGLLRGRALEVYSIAFGESETPGVRRITLVVETTDAQQTIKQLNRLIEVLEVTDVTNAEYVVRETALVKIHAPEPRQEEIRTVAAGFGARIVGSSPQTVVVDDRYTGPARRDDRARQGTRCLRDDALGKPGDGARPSNATGANCAGRRRRATMVVTGRWSLLRKT